MSAAHTPGPWRIERYDPLDTFAQISADDWGALANVVVRMEHAEIDEPTGCANARLIAAAPELLGALAPFAAFLDALENMGGNTPKTGAWYSLESSQSGTRTLNVEDFKAARAAIAKAEGRS